MMSRNAFLLIHTMTITGSDCIVQAQFYHAVTRESPGGRLLGRRLTFRLHPALRVPAGKVNLQRLDAPSLKAMMKRKSAHVKHHLRTVHIDSTNTSVSNQNLVQKLEPGSSQNALVPLPITNGSSIEEKFVARRNDQLLVDASPEETMQWLSINRFCKYQQTFQSFSGADMLRMSRDDFIQICGQADGIRLYNALHLKAVAPKLKIYVCRENSSVFNAIFLSAHSNAELLQKLSALMGVSKDQVRDIYMEGPQSIHVQLNNDLLKHIKEETMFSLEVMQESNSYIFLLKKTSKMT